MVLSDLHLELGKAVKSPCKMRLRFQKCGVFIVLSHDFQMMILHYWRIILKNGKRLLFFDVLGTKSSSFFQNDFPAIQNRHLKMMTKHAVFLSPLGKNAAPSCGELLTSFLSSKCRSKSTIGNIKVSSCQ